MITRRALGSLALAAPFIGLAHAQRPHKPSGEPVQTLILMGDLHSGYAWSPRLLAAVRREVASAKGNVAIVVNGDVFEHNNAIARGNDGAIDLALIRSFVGLAPTYVTIGNHDSDLFDPSSFVTDITGIGATLLTDISDPRRGVPYGPPAATLRAGRLCLRLAALGTPVLGVYPKAWRGAYTVPDPADYARTRLGGLLAGADLPVVLVHAGFLADRTVLPALKPPFVLHGAHDHLRFAQPLAPGAMHLHSGAWSSAFQVLRVFDTTHGVRLDARDVVLTDRSPADPVLAGLVAQQANAQLTPADLRVIGRNPGGRMSLDASVLALAASVRAKTGVDIALLQHTTFGDGLPAGNVRVVDRDSFLRFDGPIAFGTIDAVTLRDTVLPRTNQRDGMTDYARRTGDYLYATPFDPTRDTPRGRAIRVAITAYSISTAANRRELLGADLPGFAPDQAYKLSDAVAASLQPA